MKYATLALIWLLASATACSDKHSEHASTITVPSSDAVVINTASAALERWRERRPHKYSLVSERTCFCLPEYTQPMRLIIAHGELLSATFEATGETVPLKVFKSARTIESWLLRIAELEDKEHSVLQVEYDATYGYPTYFYVDRHPRIADDTETLRITGFSALP